MTVTQLDVLNAQIATLEAQLIAFDLQNTLNKDRVGLQIAQLQAQAALLPADPA